MDLAGIINNGQEALHRGSVDKSVEGTAQSPAIGNGRTSDDVRNHQSTSLPPRYARIWKGRANKVRDVNRWKYSETRPELAEIFGNRSDFDRGFDDEETDAHPTVSNSGSAAVGSASAPSSLSSSSIIPGGDISPFTRLRIPPISASEVGPGGNASLTGLCASLAGMIPNDDQTKVIAGWLFERIAKIEDRSLLDHLEVEFKMGFIADEHSGVRHRFSVLSEAVVDPIYFQQQRLKFKSDIDVTKFKALESLLDSLAMANAGNEPNAINRENILSRDVAYQVVYEPFGEKKSRVRVSYDDRGRVIECISKQRVGDLYMAMPNAAYDLKMSLSIEHPVEFQAIVAQIKDMTPGYERNKNRLKWASPGCTVDLTSVHGQSQMGQPSVTKEAEVEANLEILGRVLHEYDESRDKSTSLDKFLEVIRYTMDSARFLVRNI